MPGQAPQKLTKQIRAMPRNASPRTAMQRTAMGAWVLIYLALFTLIALILKKEYWKDVH